MFCSQCCKTRRKRLEHARSVVGNARLSRGFLPSTWVRLEKFANQSKRSEISRHIYPQLRKEKLH